MNKWHPSGTIETLKIRARVIQVIREFFNGRQVWEVDTPLMSQAGNPDPSIESYRVRADATDTEAYLHTSPEFSMKRLLAADSGSIYQICKVFRAGESGRYHNPEFTLLEWYRTGFDYRELMQEVDALLREVLTKFIEIEDTQSLSYREVFLQYAKIDPFTAEITSMQACVNTAGIKVSGMNDAAPDAWLNLILTHLIEPALPRNCPVFIYDFPTSQAALAKVRDGAPPVAERFECYLNGVELANGYSELTDAVEQQLRFEKENTQRRRNAQQQVKLDGYFLDAMRSGLPEAAGVALGIDRLIMLATRASCIQDVITFDSKHS